MKPNKFLLYLLAQFLIIYFNESIDCKLLSVHIIMRHSIRGPVYPIPNLEGDYPFPNGLAQLTETGIDLAIKMGQHLKNKYLDFYPKNSKNAIIRSTNVDRTIDTNSLVNGQLWPPNGRRDWMSPRIFHPPIPLDWSYGPYCPQGSAIFKSLFITEEFKQFTANNQDFYNFVANQTRVSADFTSIFLVSDFYKCAKSSGYLLPGWLTEAVYERLGIINLKMYQLQVGTQELIKSRGGPVIADVVKRMEEVINCANGTVCPNFFYNTLHDLQTFGFLTALGINQTTYPPFLHTIIVELHEKNEKPFIRIINLNKTDTGDFTGIRIKPSFCTDIDCDYNEFKLKSTDLIPNWKTECAIPENFDAFKVTEEYLSITDGNLLSDLSQYNRV